jgi:RimJ/RimL family protein N-acetyltransferase
MDISLSLYDGQLIRLGPIDYENDAPLESKWSHDAEYLRLLDTQPARPLSIAQVKKRFEAIEKEVEESKNLFHFTIRTQPTSQTPSRLVGHARIYQIEWTNGNGWVSLGIGDPAERNKGYGSEALRLLIHYAFGELNLYRLSAAVPEYNPAALQIFERAGFVREVCRRKALNRDGRTWDLLHLGLLQAEWQALQAG